MLQKFEQHLDTSFPFLKGKKLLLAASGGIDSMVLIHLLQQLSYPIAVAHFNFKLRAEESDGDAFFIQNYCQNNKILLHAISFETEAYAVSHKVSIQVAARELRYAWFDQLLSKEGYDYLLTAHHLDDSLETFLINFSRGTGLEGLTGIPEQNGKIMRPLLVFSRKEIEEYAAENSMQWREDSSNYSDKYLRNKIRHQIAPLFKDLNPNFLDSFQNTLKHLKDKEAIAHEAIAKTFLEISQETEHCIILDIKKIQQLNNPDTFLYEWLKPYGFRAWKDIVKLLEAKTGKEIFSKHYRLLKNRNELLLSPRQQKTSEVFEVDETDQSIDYPVHLTLSKADSILNPSDVVIYIDKNTLKFPLKIRKWQEGDYFYPSGMTGKKKLSKYFKDEKFSLLEKEKTWVLSQENDIVWIMGHRADNRFIANPQTQHILKIELLK